MKCFIIEQDGAYMFMLIKPEQLEAFYSQHGHQVIVEAEDLQGAIQQFARLRR